MIDTRPSDGSPRIGFAPPAFVITALLFGLASVGLADEPLERYFARGDLHQQHAAGRVLRQLPVE